jgi:Domain of unknown function (DUF4926)
MKQQHTLFTQVALAQDIPEHNLKRGAVSTIVEHYPMPAGEEDETCLMSASKSLHLKSFPLPNGDKKKSF